MLKKYRKLTSDQISRGVIFSSTLLPADDPTIHEIFEDDDNQSETIERLLDDKFFDDSPYKYNEIRK